MKFQIGQKVKVLKDFEGWSVKQKKTNSSNIGTIVIIDPSTLSDYCYLIEFTGSNPTVRWEWWFPKEGFLELFNELPDDGAKEKWI